VPEGRRMAVITWTTDFGTSDPYAGDMKGAALAVNEAIRFVDLTHDVAPGDVRGAAWILAKSFDRFPVGTCHAAIVDPGVGSERRGLAARAGGYFFVGPDNGILSAALAAAGDAEVREVSIRHVDAPRRGTTFDGRDVFAPAAARLVTGVPLHEFGPEVHDAIALPPFEPVRDGDGWSVEIARVDRFGNLVTVAGESFLRREWPDDWRSLEVDAGGRRVSGVRLAYADVAPGAPLLSIGGSGTLEVSVREGSAAGALGLRAGDRVRIVRPGPQRPG